MASFLLEDYGMALWTSAVALAICSKLSSGQSNRFRTVLVVCLSFVWVQVLARATLHRPARQEVVIICGPQGVRPYVTDPDHRGQVGRSPV